MVLLGGVGVGVASTFFSSVGDGATVDSSMGAPITGDIFSCWNIRLFSESSLFVLAVLFSVAVPGLEAPSSDPPHARMPDRRAAENMNVII